MTIKSDRQMFLVIYDVVIDLVSEALHDNIQLAEIEEVIRRASDDAKKEYDHHKKQSYDAENKK